MNGDRQYCVMTVELVLCGHDCPGCGLYRERKQAAAPMLDAEPRLFDASEQLAANVQAPLEMAIDETAARGRWEMPAQAAAQIPGQIALLGANDRKDGKA